MDKDNDIFREFGVTITDKESIIPVVENFERNYKLHGRMGKNFYLYDVSRYNYKTFASNNILGELYSELHKNKNCKYITYVNQLLKENYIPKYISCLVKTTLGRKYSDREVIVSRLLNLFQVNTAFNTKYSGDFVGDNSIISVDFMEASEKYFNFEDIGIPKKFTLQSLPSWDDKVVQVIKKHFPDVSEQDITEIRKDFFRSYLARFLILNDVDMDANNQGVCVDNEKHTIRLVPNHDFEFSLGSTLRDELMQELLDSAINYYYAIFPDELKKQVRILTNVKHRGLVDNIVKKHTNLGYAMVVSSVVNDNINILRDKYKEVVSKNKSFNMDR